MKRRSIVASTFLTASAFAGLTSAQAVLSVDPISQTVSMGSTVTVDIDIANVSDLYAYQFDLTFNPSVLSAVSSSEGPFLATGGSTFFISGTNDNVGGTVAATADTLTSAVSGVNGSGGLAVFTFDAIGSGTSAIGIQNETLLNSGLNVIADTTTAGSVTVRSGTTRAPEIDAASTASALTLLLGSLIVLRARRERAVR
jgi:hypothetical protein